MCVCSFSWCNASTRPREDGRFSQGFERATLSGLSVTEHRFCCAPAVSLQGACERCLAENLGSVGPFGRNKHRFTLSSPSRSTLGHFLKPHILCKYPNSRSAMFLLQEGTSLTTASRRISPGCCSTYLRDVCTACGLWHEAQPPKMASCFFSSGSSQDWCSRFSETASLGKVGKVGGGWTWAVWWRVHLSTRIAPLDEFGMAESAWAT